MCGVDTAFGAKITRAAKEALQEVTRMSYNRLSAKKLKTDIDINSTIIVTITIIIIIIIISCISQQANIVQSSDKQLYSLLL